MSRRREAEFHFGSDSFLDVLANIVGILIILMVVAGMRVRQGPLPSSTANSGLGLPAEVLSAPPEAPLVSEATVPEPLIASAPTTTEPELAAPLPELVAPAELVARVQELEEEIDGITFQAKQLGDTIATTNRQQSDLDVKLQTTKGLLEDRKTELAFSAAREAEQQHNLELARQAVARLRAQVVDAEKQTPPAEKLQHRITPVSRTVHGKELHFRLERNRIAEVPIEALVERLKEHIDRRKDWIVKTRQHKGQIGPINGFNLEYIIGVEAVTGIEELRSGMGGYRMSMRYWEVIPEEGLRGEPDDVALSQGSKFYQALVSAGHDTTLTFWVYPDSYGLYRKLQAFCHEQGFPVAARPLPRGVHISGSPNGTKSASQ